MSNNPDDTSIYNLLINSDPEARESIQAIFQSLVQGGMTAVEAFDTLNRNVEKLTITFRGFGEVSAQIGTSAAEGAQTATASIASLDEQIQRAFGDAKQLNETLQETPSGAGGGAPLPDTGAGGAGGAIGSQFAMGHALTAAGRTLGVPGLTEAGGFVYIEEGLRKIGPLFEQLNATITETPSILTPLIGGLTEMGVPMAGLLAIAGPLALAVVGVVLAIQNFNNAIKEQQAALQSILNTQDEYYKFIEKATTKEAQDKVATLNEGTAQLKKKQDEDAGIVRAYFDQEGRVFKDSMGNVFKGTNEEFMKMVADQHIIGVPATITDAIDKWGKLNQGVEDNNILVGRLTGDLKSNTFAQNDLTDAAGKAAVQAKADFTMQVQDSQLSTAAAKTKAEALKTEIDGNNESIRLLKDSGSTSKTTRDEIQRLTDANKDLGDEYDFLTKGIIPAAASLDLMAQKAKDVEEAVKKSAQAQDTYAKAIQSAQDQLASQTADGISRERTAEQQYWAGSIQDAEQRSKIVLDESRKEVTVAQDTANAILDVRTKLSQKESADLTAYNRQLVDDQTKYQDQAYQLNVDAYRKERDNQTAHLEKLADIQNKSGIDQQQALLDRNFLALAKTQQSKQTQLDAENEAYGQQQAKEQQNLQDKLADLVLHEAQLRAQQQVAYQRKLVDDQLHAQQEIDQKQVEENRKLQVLRNSEIQQLTDLTTMENYKIQIMRQGLIEQLALFKQQEEQKLQLAQRNLDSQTLTPSAGVALAHKLGLMDSGGSFGPGQTFAKGNIHEIFNFGSAGSYAIPGAAVVTPLQGGTATPVSGHNINIPINIAGGQGMDVALEVSRQVYEKLKAVFAE